MTGTSARAAHRRSPQLGRIARLLGVDVSEVTGLDGLPDDDLRVLHDLISAHLFEGSHHRFAHVAGLSKLLPGAVAGKLAERFLPPHLAARVAEEIGPAQARDLVTRVSVGYLADIAVALDPNCSEAVVQVIPVDRVRAVTSEMFRRGEYGAMAEFAGTVTLEALFGALDVASAHDLLQVVPLLVWNDNIDLVVADLPPAKLDQVLREIIDGDLWDDAAYLIEKLHRPALATIARGLFDRGEYAAMASFAGIVEPDALATVLDVANVRDLLHVVPMLEWNDNIDAVVADFPAAKLEEVLREIIDDDLWADAAQLIERLHPPALATLARGMFDRGEYDAMATFASIVSADALATVLDALLNEVATAGMWSQGEHLLTRLTAVPTDLVLSGAAGLSDSTFAVLQAAAVDGKLGPHATDLFERAKLARHQTDPAHL